MNIAPEDPISTSTAPAYFVMGLLLYRDLGTPESAVFALCLLALTAGTAAMHYRWSEGTASADHAGMNATYLALLTYGLGGGALAMGVAALAGAVLVEFVLNHRNRVLMGVCVWGAIVAGLAGGTPSLTITGVLLMAVGMAFWLMRNDIAHGLWHLLTAPGTALLYLGLAGG